MGMWKAIKRRPIPFTLRMKMILATIVCLLIPGIVTLSLSSYLTQKELKKQTLKNVEGSTELVYQHVHRLINEMIYMSNKIQFDSEINAILIENRSYTKLEDHEYSKEIIQNKWANDRRLNHLLNFVFIAGSQHYITIVSPDGTSYANYTLRNENPAALFQKEEWFGRLAELGALETYWVGLQEAYVPQEQDKSPYFITVARALRSSFKEPYGYLFISIPEAAISDVFKNYGSNQEFAVIDRHGTILSHSNRSMVGKAFPFQGLASSEEKLIQSGREELLVTTRELTFGGWNLVSLSNYTNIVGVIDRLYRNIHFIQVLIFFLFVTAIIWIIRKLTASIRRLSDVAAQVELGHLRIRSHIDGEDEIGRLGKSFDHMLDRIQDMIVQIRNEQEQKKKAELEMWLAQLNPHFLFNILNSISVRILMKGDAEHAELLNSLSSFLRMSINRNNEFISLAEELDTIKHYMKLVNFKNKDDISLAVDVPPELLTYQVPRFVLQPLVENAVVHGLQQQEGTIRVSARRDQDLLIIAVEDDGCGMTPERLQTVRAWIAADPWREDGASTMGIGLRNVRNRMNILYGTDFSMELESEPGQGTRVRLKIPVRGCDLIV